MLVWSLKSNMTRLLVLALLGACMAYVSASDCTSHADPGKSCAEQKWYYHPRSKNCFRFYFYTGGKGNDNQFDSQEECKAACMGDEPKEICELEVARGKACTAIRWFFNFGQCRRFSYNGVGGNENNYETEEECQKACTKDVPAGENDCVSRADAGKACTGAYVYGYDTRSKICRRFFYYGAEGNKNQFETKEQCEKNCIGDSPHAACELAIVSGKTCYANRWYFGFGSCRMFGYQGTGGNENNYETKEECEKACKTDDAATVVTRPRPVVIATKPAPPSSGPDCTSRPDSGKHCPGSYVFGFDSHRKTCRQFYFYGAEGNDNQFESMAACTHACLGDSPKSVCELAIASGKNCYANRWYFGYGSCRQFGYMGTGGNENNYETKEECEKACAKE